MHGTAISLFGFFLFCCAPCNAHSAFGITARRRKETDTKKTLSRPYLKKQHFHTHKWSPEKREREKKTELQVFVCTWFFRRTGQKEGGCWLSGLAKKRSRDSPTSPSPQPLFFPFSLLGEGDLHGVGRGDLESLEGVPGGRGLHLRLELDEGNVVAAGDQADLMGENDRNDRLVSEYSFR